MSEDRATTRDILDHILALVDSPEDIDEIEPTLVRCTKMLDDWKGIYLSDIDLAYLCDYVGGSEESMAAFIRNRHGPIQ